MFRNVMAVAACCFLATSFCAVAQEKTNAQILAEALKAGENNSVANNKVCKLFSMTEAGSYVGAATHTMDNAAMGTGCQWMGKADDASMLVQIVPARYHENPTHGPGYRKLPDVGLQAFVYPSMGGWHAGSLQGAHAVHVMLSGKGTSEDKTVALLKEAMKRETATGAK